MDGGGSKSITDLQVYVINLNERKDRWKRWSSQEGVRKFNKMKRVSATNGKKLDFRRDKRISVSTKLRIYRNYRRSHYEIATLGAIGATISHVRTWETFLKSGAPTCIIMEDDAIWTQESIDKANELYSSVPDGWGVWILGHYPKNLVIEHLKDDNAGWNRVYNFTAAHSYMITRSAAKILLEEPFPIDTHIEYYMTACSILKDFMIVQNPDLFIDFFRTYIGPRTNDSNTSQHKKMGCPTCDIPDDYSQLYKHFTRNKKDGMVVSDVVYGKQSSDIVTFKNGVSKDIKRGRKTHTRKIHTQKIKRHSQ